MNKQIQAVSNYAGQLTGDACALMVATAGVAGEKVGEARKRLAAALEHGKGIYDNARGMEAEGARVARKAMREHPYESIAAGVAAGVFIGYLLTRACSRHPGENQGSPR